MTTPRVTVPVEPTVRMLNAGAAHMRDDALYTPNSVWSAMLSAAPAPEGVAVAWMYRETPGERWQVTMDRRQVDAYFKAFKTAEAHALALATREEAPEEAGDPSLVDWFRQFIDNYVEETNGGDGEALIACLDRVRDSYRQHATRAQPPAREDAQVYAIAPASERRAAPNCEGCDAPPLHMHADDCPVMAGSLVALQAEQKGGAA